MKKIPQDEIIVSNHVSILDIIYFMSRLGLPSFVSKVKYNDTPFFLNSQIISSRLSLKYH
jgi:1-acyl-sn-glycerol-3-phosphate acyltransferase